jgi:hypothetical protein
MLSELLSYHPEAMKSADKRPVGPIASVLLSMRSAITDEVRLIPLSLPPRMIGLRRMQYRLSFADNAERETGFCG